MSPKYVLREKSILYDILNDKITFFFLKNIRDSRKSTDSFKIKLEVNWSLCITVKVLLHASLSIIE